jgi:hypothetical protein
VIAGANAAENLLLVIETQRKGQGIVDGVRKELQTLGYDAKAIGPAMMAGAEQGIAEIMKLSRTIDTTSKSDVTAFRNSAAAIREMAQAAGVAPAQVNKLAVAEEVLTQRIKAANQETRAQAGQLLATSNRMDAISPKARTAANAFTTVAFAATGMSGGLQSSIIASGSLVTSLATLSSSAAIAASASGLGAVIVVLGALIPLLRDAKIEAEGLDFATRALGHMDTRTEVQGAILGIEAEIARTKKEIEDFDSFMTGYVSKADRDKLQRLKGHLEAETTLLKQAKGRAVDIEYALADERVRARERAEREAQSKAEAARRREAERRKRDAETALSEQHRLANAVLDLASARDNDIYTQRRLKIERAYAEEIAMLEELKISDARRLQLQQQAFQVRNLSLEALKEENRLMNEAHARETRMTRGTMTGNVEEVYRAREAEIDAEREADIKRGISKENAEARAQLKIRQLQKETLQGSMRDLKTLEDATINSKSRTIRAIGAAANVIRRLEIGAQASLAAVESARMFAKVPGYLAAQQYLSAALAAASGVQLAAAAALGFREALGGGGSAAGGGGAGSGAGAPERGTFEPRTSSQGAGSVVINIITRNPYGRDSIQQVAWELNRSGILNRPPIEIPPTSGITPQGVLRGAA